MPIVFPAPPGYALPMALHLIKLCVGCDSIAELADWQKSRLKQLRAKGKRPELVHVTRMTPKRSAELLEGGSLYWVIKGHIAARQKLLAYSRRAYAFLREPAGTTSDRQRSEAARR